MHRLLAARRPENPHFLVWSLNPSQPSCSTSQPTRSLTHSLKVMTKQEPTATPQGPMPRSRIRKEGHSLVVFIFFLILFFLASFPDQTIFSRAGSEAQEHKEAVPADSSDGVPVTLIAPGAIRVSGLTAGLHTEGLNKNLSEKRNQILGTWVKPSTLRVTL